jgi:hypothetical protein
MKAHGCLVIGSLALVGLATPAQAQVVRKSETPSLIMQELDLESFFCDFNTANTFYRKQTRSESARNIFKDLNLEFVQLSSSRGDDAVGVTYDYDRTFGEQDPAGPGGWNSFVNLRSVGTLSFDSAVKPRDFLDTRITWRMAYDAGGLCDAATMVEAYTRGLNRYRDSLGGICVESPPGTPAANMELLEILVDFEDPATLEASEAWRQSTAIASELLSDQTHFDFGLDLGVENSQDFAQRQYRFGLASTLEYKTWDADSYLPWLNVMDYPASVLRYLTGYDQEWGPSGTTFPIVSMDVSQIVVDENRARRTAGDDGNFLRAHLEASYRSALGEIGTKLYHLDASYQYYLDVDPSSSIQAADLDQYDYLKAEISTDQGLFFAIDVGQLPFEVRDTTVVSLGYRVAAR